MRQNTSSVSLFLLGSLVVFADCFPRSHSFALNKASFHAEDLWRPRSIVEKSHSKWDRKTYQELSPVLRRHSLVSVKTQSATADYDPFETANTIEPETMSLRYSIRFYSKFLVKHFYTNRVNKKLQEKRKGKKRAMWKKLDEQRRNVMTLAGYTPSLVVPSFLFLFLGALMTSIVPSYYSKCIQCVSTLTTSKSQLVEAMVGLGVSSTLAALFTGLRGSLFWIGGKYLVKEQHQESRLMKSSDDL
jgi:hypothetical protein